MNFYYVLCNNIWYGKLIQRAYLPIAWDKSTNIVYMSYEDAVALQALIKTERNFPVYIMKAGKVIA